MGCSAALNSDSGCSFLSILNHFETIFGLFQKEEEEEGEMVVGKGANELGGKKPPTNAT